MAKRRPAPPITPASAPQVLSPKRLCPQSLQTSTINQLYINNTTTALPVTTSDLITKTTVSSQTITNHQNINMDNQMGQMGPMAPMALSQSMDSVNTASNEEEVSFFFFLIFYKNTIFKSNMRASSIYRISFTKIQLNFFFFLCEVEKHFSFYFQFFFCSLRVFYYF